MSNKYYGTVTRVIDGDTFQVKDKFGNTQVIRVFGVDTPERKQKFGPEATEFTKKLIDKQEVYVDAIDLGKYQRVVAIVYINGQSLGEILLAEGIAFFAGDNHKLAYKYAGLQEKARLNSKGVHKLGIQSPAQYRKNNQRVKNPTFTKSQPAPVPLIRFKPERPNFLEKVTKFFSEMFEKNEDHVAKREAIKKAELERIEKKIADRKMENAIKENLEKREAEKLKASPKKASVEEPDAKLDTTRFMQRFRERSKKM